MSQEYIDLTHPIIVGMPAYPGDEHFAYRPKATFEADGYNVRTMTIGSHTGTHIDAPFHFFAEGRKTDEIGLSELIGPVVLVDLVSRDLKPRQMVTWEDIKPFEEKMRPGVIVIVYTGWSKYWGSPEYFHHPFLSEDVARGIMERGVRVVGMDTLNPDETPMDGVGGEHGFKFHEVVLGGGAVIGENMANLGQLAEAMYKDPAKEWTVNLIPLNLEGSDGSPVRAFAYYKAD